MNIVINPVKSALTSSAQDFHLLVRLQSQPQADHKRTPLNLVLVIDRSGSMQGHNLEEAKRCVIDLVGRMDPTDRVGVVQYDDQVSTVVPLGLVAQVADDLKRRVDEITANGGTDLHSGWLHGSAMLAPFAGRGASCHVMLLSDGQANQGLCNTLAICEQVAALANAGVTTTTVGLGAGFNEELMAAMAKAGQGSAHYGERAVDLAETFEAELGLLTNMQWRAVEMTIQHGPAGLEMLNTYERTEAGWRMPSVANRSECWALLRMPMRAALDAQANNAHLLQVTVQATDAEGSRQTFTGQLQALPQTTPTDYEALPSHELVQRRIIELMAARLQLQIREAALHGDWMTAECLLRELETLGRDEPWVAASIAFARRLMEERDAQLMSKEMLYKSHKMNQRLSGTDEGQYGIMNEEELPAFLRRKAAEGRHSRS